MPFNPQSAIRNPKSLHTPEPWLSNDLNARRKRVGNAGTRASDIEVFAELRVEPRRFFQPPGQANRERAAFAELAFERHVAAQQPAQFADDREAQAGARILAGHGVAVGKHARCLAEFLEHELLFIRADADAGIGHFQPQIALFVALGRNDDPSALGRELDRVGQQVVENLLNLGLVLSQRRQRGGRIAIEIDVLFLGQRPGHFAQRRNQRR